MKLNKTLIIAGLVAGSVFAANVAVRAQDSTNTPPAHPPVAHGGANFDYIATQLALTDDQKEKVRPILDEMRQKTADLRKDTTLAMEDRRAKMKEIRENTSTKLKDILTPQQFEKWQKMGARQRPTPPAATPPAATPPAAVTPPAGGTTTQQ
jgi:Spy/CpxP family protein refolding chaperone